MYELRRNWAYCYANRRSYIAYCDCILFKNGAFASVVHGIAPIYIWISIVFGYQMIKWADVRFNYRFGNSEKPMKIKYGKEHARKARKKC